MRREHGPGKWPPAQQRGATDREIAERLGLATKTVNTHVSHILLKLAEPNRTMAVARAVAQGLLKPLE